METLPRGIRDNNPGNIRDDGIEWQGLVPESQRIEHDNYCQFISPDYGIRAIYHILLTYHNEYKLNTISEIIERWAPSSENDTMAYINDVANHVQYPANSPLNFFDNVLIATLIAAIIYHENGMEPYTQDEILRRMRL